MTKRNYGIDLLRILSMVFVILLHTLGQGGILQKAPAGSGMYLAAWCWEIIAYGAADVFAIISGYVWYSDTPRKTRLSSYLALWLQVVFYSAATAFVFWLIRPDLVSLKSVKELFFPLKNGLYWYFTAYTGLFAVKPLLDHALAACSRETACKVFLAIFALFGCFDLFFNRFYLHSGYSFIWVLLLYMLGGIIKKCDIGRRIPSFVLVLGILLTYTVTCLSKFIWTGKLVKYHSPTVLLAAILYVILFSRLALKKPLQRAVSFVAPGVFSAYILNCQRDVWQYVMKGQFSFLIEKPIPLMLGATLLFSLLFVAAGALVDWVRRWLFERLKIKKGVEALGNALQGGLEVIAKNL